VEAASSVRDVGVGGRNVPEELFWRRDLLHPVTIQCCTFCEVPP
jgi:hypothetical protein